MTPSSQAATRQSSTLTNGPVRAAMPARGMRRIAAIRLVAFKRLAGQLKRPLGLKHSHALERLARACGYAHYHELHTVVASGPQKVRSDLDVPEEALIELWQAQLDAAFGVSVVDVLGATDVCASFRRLFILSPAEDEQAADEDPELSSVTDPALSASDWHDPEFRASLHRQLERQAEVQRDER